MLRMGSSKRLPRNFKEETSDKNSTEQDDVVLQATWIFHRLLGFWLLIYLEWVTFLLICCVVAIWFFILIHWGLAIMFCVGGFSGFHDRCSNSATEQPCPVASVQDSPISHNHWSLLQLKANLRVKRIDSVTSAHPFLFFYYYFFVPEFLQALNANRFSPGSQWSRKAFHWKSTWFWKRSRHWGSSWVAANQGKIMLPGKYD